jgi:hypothetical protein
MMAVGSMFVFELVVGFSQAANERGKRREERRKIFILHLCLFPLQDALSPCISPDAVFAP